MSDPLEGVLCALRAEGYEPKGSGTRWTCRCPSHDDRNPSLSISVGEDGRVLLCCQRNPPCTADAITAAIGLTLADLFPRDPTRQNGRTARTRQRVTVTNTSRKAARKAGIGDGDAKTFPTARDAVAELERLHGPRSASWTYHNAGSDPVGLVVRWNMPAGKDVRPVSRKAGGLGWIIGGMPTPRPLYALPDLLAMPAGSQVFITEGEKAADAARALGLTASTSAHGSKSAAKADWSPVAGHDVVILPDNDNAGELYAADVARLCTAAGAKSVRIVRLVELWAGMPEGGDMADLVEHRGGDVDPIRAEVEALASKTEPEAVTPDAPEGGTVPAFVPFPVYVLPEPIRSFVTDAAKAIGCDASYIALPLLSGLASAIGNTHRIALKRGWTEPAIVWTAIVGESGTAKSPAMELALRAIRKRQHDAVKEHTAAMKDHADAVAIYERNVAQWKRVKSDTLPPAKPETPIADRCWTDDATTEALAVLLQQNPRGLLMVRDELAGWFNFDRYAGGKGGGDAAKWLEMFGGRPMVVDRKGGGTLYVPCAAVSIAGGIQPETLRRALVQEHRDNGLAARLLLSSPPRMPKQWTEADVDEVTEAAVAMVFERLYSLTPETDDNGDQRPRLVTLADDGKRAWVKFYNEHAHEMVNLSGDESAAWSKLEGYAARLTLVVHLTRWAAGDTTLRDPGRVDEASIAAGVVLARWFGDEARRVYAILSESDDDRETRRLVEWIERKGGSTTARDLTHGLRTYRGDSDAAELALSALVKAGVGQWEAETPGPKGGRPAKRFRLVNAVTVTETPANSGNDKAYGDGDTEVKTSHASDAGKKVQPL